MFLEKANRILHIPILKYFKLFRIGDSVPLLKFGGHSFLLDIKM